MTGVSKEIGTTPAKNPRMLKLRTLWGEGKKIGLNLSSNGRETYAIGYDKKERVVLWAQKQIYRIFGGFLKKF